MMWSNWNFNQTILENTLAKPYVVNCILPYDSTVRYLSKIKENAHLHVVCTQMIILGLFIKTKNEFNSNVHR